jgi:hypothetical protein
MTRDNPRITWTGPVPAVAYAIDADAETARPYFPVKTSISASAPGVPQRAESMHSRAAEFAVLRLMNVGGSPAGRSTVYRRPGLIPTAGMNRTGSDGDEDDLHFNRAPWTFSERPASRSYAGSVGQRTAGDLMFERYLSERGLEVSEHEPDLGIGVRPEYLLDSGRNRCRTEVKEFAPGSWPIRRGSTSQQQVLKPIRRQIHEAARKLRNAVSLGYPLVVVLTDPHQALWGLLWPRELVAAVLGNMTIVLPISPSSGSQARPAALVSGRNGELRHDHPYVSAVVVVHELHTGQHRSDTYVTHSPGAVELASGFFAGADDAFYDYTSSAGTYVLRESR